jgi:hypothetical protein
MLAISAREAYTSIMPSPMAMKPQNRSAVPPSYKTKEKTLRCTSVRVRIVFVMPSLTVK